MRRVAIIATASGCGKTTFGHALAARLGVRFVDLDAINHQAGWTELDAEELRRRMEPLVCGNSWVIDGSYQSKLGQLVLEAADTAVRPDPPRRIWPPHLVLRTLRRIAPRASRGFCSPAEVAAFLRAAPRLNGQPVSDTDFCQGEPVPTLHQSFHTL